jgi:hypothetical protein
MPDKINYCETCKWYEAKTPTTGVCREQSPPPVTAPGSPGHVYVTVRAAVDPLVDWCGRWAKK